MKRNIAKAPRIALCRACHGTGIVLKAVKHPFQLFMRKRQKTTEEACPQCGGNGRVTVSAETELDIRPCKSKEQEE